MKRVSQSVFFLPSVLIISFLCGVASAYIFFSKGLSTPQELRSKDSGFSYVNQLLECGEISGALPKEIKAAEEDVRTYIEIQKANGTLADIGLYYRDLNNGPVFGINEQSEFSPGSLLKVPLLFALYRESEVTPNYFNTKIEYTGGSSTAKQDVPVGQPITPGHTYSARELISHMIQQSDNNATLLLYQLLGYEKTAETYKDLGLPAPQVNVDYTITVRGYATFFRLLFNATYLSKANSIEALRILSESDFKDGIVAGVPDGTVVSHKFGERHFEGDGAIEQLHDCGIVYKPNHPYVLCIMTRGHDVKTLAPVIAQISKIIYTDTSK